MPLVFQKARYNYADILALDDGNRYELYDGQLVALASPANIHQELSAALTAQFYNHLVGKKCKVYPAPFDVRLFEMHGDDPKDIGTVLQPDISIVCDPQKTKGHGCKGAPDLVIEILSPDTQRRDRREKYVLYQKAGVKEYWVVDPDTKVVLVHTLEDGRYGTPVAYISNSKISVTVLDDCTIDLSTVFPPSS